MNKKLLILTEGNKKSGPATWANGLIRHLRSAGWDVRDENIFKISSLKKLPNVGKYDVLHVYHFGGYTLLFLFIAKVARARIVYTIHGDVLSEKKGKRGLKKLLWVPLHRLVFSLADVITCPSKYIQDKIKYDFPVADKTVLIYNGIDLNAHATRAQIKDKSNFTILTVTNFNYWEKARGIVPLIEAVEILRKNFPYIRLQILGAGTFYDTFYSQYGNIPTVTFYGFRKVESFINKADMMVHSSFLDTSSYAVLEAVVSELPVISVKVGGVPEILPVSAITEPNRHSISGKIEKLMSNRNLLKKLQDDETSKIKIFGWDVVIKDFIFIYEG